MLQSKLSTIVANTYRGLSIGHMVPWVLSGLRGYQTAEYVQLMVRGLPYLVERERFHDLFRETGAANVEEHVYQA